MNIAVYTAVAGNKRVTLRDPPVVHAGVDYIAFTDQDTRSLKVWQIRPIIPYTMASMFTNRRNAKVFKILPEIFLGEYDATIYHDGGHFCLMPPSEIFDTYMPGQTDDLAVFKHRWNTCVYDEGVDIIKGNRDLPGIVNAQLKAYRNSGYPEHNGLFELGVIIRKRSYRNTLINLRWWEQICKWSSRDQLSFPFVMRSLNLKPRILPGTIFNQNIVPHRYDWACHIKGWHNLSGNHGFDGRHSAGKCRKCGKPILMDPCNVWF